MATRSKTRKKTTSKSVTFSSVPAGDRYLDLVRECPLRMIRSESENGQAIAMLDRLSELGNDRTADETEYLLSLTVFVKKYEDEHHHAAGFRSGHASLPAGNPQCHSKQPGRRRRDWQFPRFPKSWRASESSGSSTSRAGANFGVKPAVFLELIDD